MKVHVLLIGAHPDDVEWGAGGIAILLQAANVPFAILDITRGEKGSRGAPEDRVREAQTAARFLGGVPRENLEMPDCAIVDGPASRKRVADIIRQYRPEIVVAPYWKDRHPDHAAAGRMVRNCRLFCTLKNSDSVFRPHKPKAFLYVPLHHTAVRPTFVVDVSAVYGRKLELLRIHESQFSKTAQEFGVLSHGGDDYLFALESRDRFWGSLIGKPHGEALVADGPVALSSLTDVPGLGGGSA